MDPPTSLSRFPSKAANQRTPAASRSLDLQERDTQATKQDTRPQSTRITRASHPKYAENPTYSKRMIAPAGLMSRLRRKIQKLTSAPPRSTLRLWNRFSSLTGVGQDVLLQSRTRTGSTRTKRSGYMAGPMRPLSPMGHQTGPRFLAQQQIHIVLYEQNRKKKRKCITSRVVVGSTAQTNDKSMTPCNNMHFTYFFRFFQNKCTSYLPRS